jgi:hypothetical protein
MESESDRFPKTTGALWGVWNTLMSPDALRLGPGYLSEDVEKARMEMARVTESEMVDEYGLAADTYLINLREVLAAMGEYPQWDGVIPHPPTRPQAGDTHNA